MHPVSNPRFASQPLENHAQAGIEGSSNIEIELEHRNKAHNVLVSQHRNPQRQPPSTWGKSYGPESDDLNWLGVPGARRQRRFQSHTI